MRGGHGRPGRQALRETIPRRVLELGIYERMVTRSPLLADAVSSLLRVSRVCMENSRCCGSCEVTDDFIPVCPTPREGRTLVTWDYKTLQLVGQHTPTRSNPKSKQNTQRLCKTGILLSPAQIGTRSQGFPYRPHQSKKHESPRTCAPAEYQVEG